MADPENWDKWIKKVESFEFPDIPVRLSKAEGVSSARDFAASHLKMVKANNGKRTYRPYMSRLWRVYQMFKKDSLPEN